MIIIFNNKYWAVLRMVFVRYFLNADDDTYIYGDKMFECDYSDETDEYIQPYIRMEKNKIIKFYRNKRFFVVYENDKIVEIIKTMTCWSDDVVAYKLKDNIAYSYDEVYHGRPYKSNEECSVDFNEFIRTHGL